MKRFNILHLTDHNRIGGPGKTIINSAKFIDSDNFHIHISSFVDAQKRQTEFSKAVYDISIPYLALYDKKGINIGQLAKLKKYILKNDIKILHSHGYKTNLMAVLMKWVLKDLIIVTTYHGWIINNFRQKVLSKIDLFFSRFFDGIISVSQDISRKFSTFNKNRTFTGIIHNALVISDYHRQGKRSKIRNGYSVKGDDILIGVFGRLSIEKGGIEIIDAFYELQKETKIVKLIFLGEGPLEKELKDKVRNLKLDSKIIFAGYQNPVQPFYESVDIVVSPSQTEGLSNVILEAMAFKLPVVATCVGGNSEIVNNNINGLLVEPKNPIELKNAISFLIQSSKRKSQIAERGYETVKNKFNFERRMEKIEVLYSSIIENRIKYSKKPL